MPTRRLQARPLAPGEACAVPTVHDQPSVGWVLTGCTRRHSATRCECPKTPRSMFGQLRMLAAASACNHHPGEFRHLRIGDAEAGGSADSAGPWWQVTDPASNAYGH